MQSLKKIHAWAQMQVPLYYQNVPGKGFRHLEYSKQSGSLR